MESIINVPTPPSQSPWWVTAGERFGIPALFLGYLIWMMATGQASALKDINATLLAQKSAVAEVVTVTRQTAAETEASRIRLEGYLRLVCVNTARSSQDRSTCLSVR